MAISDSRATLLRYSIWAATRTGGSGSLAGDVPHLMFPVTFVLFRLVHHVFASWTAYICIPRSSENATPSARVLH